MNRRKELMFLAFAPGKQNLHILTIKERKIS